MRPQDRLIAEELKERLAAVVTLVDFRVFGSRARSDARQECDYKELVESSAEEAAESVKMANEFVRTIKSFIDEKGEF